MITKKKNYKIICITIEIETLKEINRLANNNNRSVSYVIKDMINENLKNNGGLVV
jgi:predicted DNA-binding protein